MPVLQIYSRGWWGRISKKPVRQIYLCDWCQAESDVPGHIGTQWQKVAIVDVHGYESDVYLCRLCVSGIEKAKRRCIAM